MPRARASSRLPRVRPTPTTSPTAPAALSASAHDPPISPTPTTTSLFTAGLAPESVRERGEEALVLRRQPDGDAQPLRQAVAADRAHDDSLAQQVGVDARGIADA